MNWDLWASSGYSLNLVFLSLPLSLSPPLSLLVYQILSRIDVHAVPKLSGETK